MSIPLLTETLIPSECNFSLSRTERINSSKFTAASQVISSPTGLWTVSLKFTNVRRTDAQKLIAFLWSLRGSYGQFRLSDWSAPTPTGIGGVYHISDISTAAPGMVSITTETPETKVASVGDYVEINGELKGLIADVVTDSLGKATVLFEPFLRNPITADIQINFDAPTGIFRLKPNTEVPRVTSQKMVMSEISIECIEAVTV